MVQRKRQEPIAERILTDRSGHRIKVSMTAPEKVTKGEWRCAFRVGKNVRQYAVGLDAFQAIIIALEGIRTTLDRLHRSVEWEGGDDSGFPRSIPQFFGRDFSAKLERSIDEEVHRFASAARPKRR